MKGKTVEQNDYFEAQELDAWAALRDQDTERRRRFAPTGEKMRQIGDYHFPTPDNTIETEAWRSSRTYRVLNRNVIVAANTRIEGVWKAYIGAVPGMRHEEEFDAILKGGTEVPEEIALAIFPQFHGIPYAK